MDESTLNFPRVMIAAPHGRSGKTIVTLGLLRALAKRGMVVQPFKKGPDYIDTGWQSRAAGRQSRNLDSYFMDGPCMATVLDEASQGADVGIIEAAMGLYDGLDVEGSCSSATVALKTKTPVILVLDVTRVTRTAAAIVLGCIEFDRRVNVAGVIINRVRSPRHERIIRQSIEQNCAVPVIGAVPESERLALADRHLGLVTNLETADAERLIDDAASIVEASVGIDALLDIAATADELSVNYRTNPLFCRSFAGYDPSGEAFGGGGVRIAVVRDDVFSFYYPENLDALKHAGAELVFVDSLHDAALPEDVDGLFIGGGFPEAFGEALEANDGFRSSVRAFALDGGPVYAECGGLMYLAEGLVDGDGRHAMSGVFDFDVIMEPRRQGHGYAVVEATEQHPWMPAGIPLVGHEHHHSRVSPLPDVSRYAFKTKRGKGVDGLRDGIFRGNTVANYFHVNALASPQWAMYFVAAAQRYRKRLQSGAENPVKP